MLTEGYSHENWRAKFGSQTQIGLAACALFNEGKKDIKKVQALLSQVTEPQKRNLPDFYKALLHKIEGELVSITLMLKPSAEEETLEEVIAKTPSDIGSRFALAKL